MLDYILKVDQNIWIRLGKAAAVVLIAFIVLKLLKDLQKKYIKKYEFSKNTNTIFDALFNILRSIVIIGMILLVLQASGVNVSSIMAGLGLVSVIIGLALQNEVADYIMGIHILTDNFFKVGDFIRYKDIEGEVISYSLKTTRMINYDTNETTVICNRNINEITVLTKRYDINIPVSYEEDTNRVAEIFKEIAAEVSEKYTCVYKGINYFKDSSVEHLLRLEIPRAELGDVRRRVLKITYEHFSKEGITIPYNKIDVIVKNDHAE